MVQEGELELLDNFGKRIGIINGDDYSDVLTLREEVARITGIKPVRQRLSYLQNGRTVLLENVSPPADVKMLVVKDLGPQISWRLVFILEYLGPLLIHLLAFLYYRPTSFIQCTGFALILFHFAKREFETLFVHRFSHSTMPLSNLFKNSAHYWLLSGSLIAYNLYSKPLERNDTTVLLHSFAFLLLEALNYRTHCVLRDLRPVGSNRRAIPVDWTFRLVSCPNYLFEFLAWVTFSSMTRLRSAWFFTFVASVQMYLWAVKKHRRYLQEFGKDYARLRRTPMIPFLK